VIFERVVEKQFFICTDAFLDFCRRFYEIGTVSFPFLASRCYESTYTSISIFAFCNDGKIRYLSYCSFYTCFRKPSLLEQYLIGGWWYYNGIWSFSFYISN